MTQQASSATLVVPVKGRPFDETVSIWLSIAFAVGSVLYFLVVPLYSPGYSPKREWVWAVPALINLVWLTIQVACLFAAAVRPTDLGAGDVLVSYITSLVLLVLGCAWVFGKLDVSPFMVYILIVNFGTAAAETILTQLGKVLFARRTVGIG